MASKEIPTRVKESIDNTQATYKQLGKSGLRVSVPVLGMMSHGSSDWAPWVINEDKVPTSLISMSLCWICNLLTQFPMGYRLSGS